MEIVEPKVSSWLEYDLFDHIAKCARVCYASDSTINNVKFCNTLLKNKHRSMFRHAGVYYIIPKKLQLPYKAYIGAVVKLVNNKYYVSTNEQAAKEYWDKEYVAYRIDISQAMNDPIFQKYKLLRFTLCIETGIDITRELNRKSPNNISEQSTRYVDFNKKLGIRFKKCHWMKTCGLYRTLIYKFMAKTIEWFYKISRSKYGLNLPPQDARWILALDTMSKAVYTYTVAEWEYIINMRLWDYTGKAHEDARIVAKLIYDELKKLDCDIVQYKDVK